MTSELLIAGDGLGLRSALVVDGSIASFDFERRERLLAGTPPEDEARQGSIWRARVKRLAGGMRAAFLDLGRPVGPEAFLPAGEIVSAGRRTAGRQDLSGVIRQGSTVVVQVTREASGSKGPKVTMSPTLTGAFSVLAPFDARMSGVSRSAPAAQRGRLKELVPKLESLAAETMAGHLAGTRLAPPSGFAPGVVLRVAAAQATDEAIEADVRVLAGRWARIYRAASEDGRPRLVAAADGLVAREMRKALVRGVDRVLTDDAAVRDEARHFLADLPDALRPELALESLPAGTDLFAAQGLGVPEALLLGRVVTLPSGTWLAFDRTEALTVVDVNAGHGADQRQAHAHGRDAQALSVDLEAADAIACQLAARGVTGAVVIDFITLRPMAERRQVCARLRQAFARVGVAAQVGDMSNAGLVEVVRRGGPASLASRLTTSCPACGAFSRALADDALVTFFARRLARTLAARSGTREAVVGVQPRLHALVASPGCQVAVWLRRETGVAVAFECLEAARSAALAGQARDPIMADASFEVLSWGH